MKNKLSKQKMINELMKLPIQRTKSNWNNLSLKEVIKSYEEAKGLNLLKEEEQE